MRVSKVLLGIGMLTLLSGCAALPTPPSAEALAGAGESATKSAISNAVVATAAFFVNNPGATSVTLDDIAGLGYDIEGIPVELHVTGPDAFCVDAVAASGARFKSAVGAGIGDGACVAGTDY